MNPSGHRGDHVLKDVASALGKHAEARFDSIQRFPGVCVFTHPPVVAMHTRAPRRARTTHAVLTVLIRNQFPPGINAGAYLNSLVVYRQEAVRLMQGFLPLNHGSAGSRTFIHPAGHLLSTGEG